VATIALFAAAAPQPAGEEIVKPVFSEKLSNAPGLFEPAGSRHLVSENASATESATLLVVFVAEDGAQLTIS